MLIVAALGFAGAAIPELIYTNEGDSVSIGSVRNGKLKNAYLIPYSGDNHWYFSAMSYFLMNNGYTHSKVYHTVMNAYKTCEKTCPGVKFRIMECSDRSGGKMLIHRTHQNGMSIDFMVPKKNGSTQSRFFDGLGMWHYLLDFTASGKLKLNKKVEIDFETMGKHILALDKAARSNGLSIRKIILNTGLKDDLYATSSGQKVKERGIYIVRSLSDIVNRVHDDHYHVDFEEVR